MKKRYKIDNLYVRSSLINQDKNDNNNSKYGETIIVEKIISGINKYRYKDIFNGDKVECITDIHSIRDYMSDEGRRKKKINTIETLQCYKYIMKQESEKRYAEYSRKIEEKDITEESNDNKNLKKKK